ncbi:MAG TPA: hypothetical protein VJV79_06280 [Polyangiaceae bacterium]|nr:hypothetical protein [Polyangiaceae bacterium]
MRQLWLLLVPLALACGGSDDDDSPLGPPVLHPVPGCESIDPAPCDVRRPECQQRLLSMAACLRGESVMAPPAIQVLSEADYSNYLAELLAAQMQDPNIEQVEVGFNLLKLIERGALSAQARAEDHAKFAAGVYRTDTKDVLIIDHGDSFDAEAASSVLVHEFVHALQDRDLGLSAFKAQANSVDEGWAYSAMLEGEATLHHTRYGAAMLGLDSAKVDWTAHFQNSLAHGEQRLLSEASPYLASYKYFPYAWGGRYMHFTWLAGGMDAVRGRFSAPPTMTHTLLASTMGAVDSDITPNELTLAAPPPEWTQIAGPWTLGAWGIFLAFEKAATTLDSVRAMALAWRGDSLGIYASHETSQTAVLWRLEFTDESTAVQAKVAAERIVGVGNVRQDGHGVVIAKTDGGSAVDWAFQFD